MEELYQKLKYLPTSAGVYVMLDKNGQIIYVGKAKNLKNRVRQYFFNTSKTVKVEAMVNNIADFYYIMVPTEIDALSLENNLIKKHKPRYNILLKDDKTYPYIKIDLKEKFPAFSVTRRIKKDGAKYFGPFMGGVNVNSVLETVNLVFNVRPCNKKLNPEKKLKPCLNYHINKCCGACCGEISEKEYKQKVNDAIEFLSGETSQAEKILTERMIAASENMEFETALKYKEKLSEFKKVGTKRLTSLNKFVNADVIAVYSNGIYSAVNLSIVRNGRMLGNKNFSFENGFLEDKDALSQFILRYYDENTEFPDQIICSEDLGDLELLKDYFKRNFEKNTDIVYAKQGDKRKLCEMGETNAKQYLEVNIDKIKHKEDMTVKACASLKEKLNLKNFPRRMECYDISNISGVDKVGSMVVFINGEPEKSSYRRFKIKTVEGADDYKSHQEMMQRRLKRLETEPEKFPKPDLMVIDGGKGQLSAVKEVLDGAGVTDIDLIALAERDEEIFVPNNSLPVKLERRDYCLRMLQRIRDEAHRFAITYHRTLRGKRALSSLLDDIKGLGKVKKAALLNAFKDMSGIASATKEELMKVNGIGEKQADAVLNKLTEEGLK